MESINHRKRKIASAISITVAAIILIAASAYVYGMGRERRIVYSHLYQYHPVIHDLFSGKIKRQQNADELITDFPPSTISRHDDYMTLLYATDDDTVPPCCISSDGYIHVISMDNRLVKAFAVEGTVSEVQYVFFNDFDESMEKDYSASRWRYITAR